MRERPSSSEIGRASFSIRDAPAEETPMRSPLSPLAALPALTLLLGLAACGGGEGSGNGAAGASALSGPLAGSNLLLVTLDTTRADRLGCYGRADAGTGTLDALANEGVRFERCISVAPITLPSHASILSGRPPFEHGARNNGTHSLPGDVPTLAILLQEQGYATGAVVSAFVLDARFGLDRGFSSYDDDLSEAEEAPMFMFRETVAEDGVRRARRFLDGVEEGQPWFLWLHLFDPHANYTPPEPFRSRHSDPYQGEIAYADYALGTLLADLERRGQREATLVAVTADHGEALGEHGETTHGLYVYDATTRVPFLLAHPRLAQGTVVEPVVSGVDLAPTVLDLLGLPPVAGMTGRSLAEVCLGGAPLEPGPGAYSEGMPAYFDHGWSDLRSLREDRWRFVRAPRPELYSMEGGAREAEDLSGQRPAELQRLEAELERRLARGERDSRAGSLDAADPEVRATLEALGYASGQAEGRIGDGPLADPKDKAGFWKSRNEAMELIRSGEYARAEPVVRRLVSEEPGDALLATSYGEILRQVGRREEALEWMRRTVDGGRGTGLDWLELAELEQELGVGDWRARLEAAKALAPKDPMPWVREGDFLVEAGEHGAARKAYERAFSLDPACAEAWVGLGHLEHQIGQDAAAEVALQRGLEADPLLTDGWFDLGVVCEAQGRGAEARGHYERVLQLDADHVRSLVNLGGLLRGSGDRPGAEHLYRRAHRLDPDDPRVAYNLALMLLEDQKAPEAEAILLDALAADPTVPQLRRLRAFALEAQGRLAEAGALALELRQGDPRDPWLAVFALEGLLAQGRQAQAEALLAEARRSCGAELDRLVAGRPRLSVLRGR